jgi:DNA-binding winged helix-turn-helix (wHTH) protein
VKILFAPYTLDLDTRQLTRHDRARHLSPKAFQLLAVLAQERPKVLSKAELQQRLWPDTFVAEANLSNLVAEIRMALGDRGRVPKWVRTAHGVGYAFCGNATTVTSPRGRSERTICWLEWGRRRFPMGIGRHIIGRDPDVDIRLDASTVSRRHASIAITEDSAMLEDFGSKNGTRRGSHRVTAPVPLTDGDAIHIGSLLVTFHARAREMSTDTVAEAGL